MSPPIAIPLRAECQPNALIINHVDKETWTSAFRALDATGEAVRWYFGDLIVAGEKHIGEAWVREQINGHDDRVTLWIYAAVARRFKPQDRRRKLRWAHHHEVAFLPGVRWQSYLNTAEEKKLQHAEVRALAKRGEAEVAPEKAATSFRLVEWARLFLQWIRSEEKTTPIPLWPVEKKESIRDALAPIMEIYRQVTE